MGSNEQVAKWLYDELGLPHPRQKPDAKHPSVDRTHLNKLNTHETRLVLKYRQVQKLAGTYLAPLSLADTISGMWKIFGTETGRLSCELRNLQNLPDVINALLRAPDGMVPIHADYKGFELRIGAYLSRDRTMIAYLSDPTADMHWDCARSVYGVTGEVPVTAADKRLKTKAKSAMFERMYGGGVDMAAAILNIPRREAQTLFAWQDKHIAGFLAWAETWKAECLAQGYVESLFGRRRILHDLNSTDERIVHKAEKEAVNTPIQGPGGDCTKRAMVLLWEPLLSMNGMIARNVHDSIDIWVPPERVNDAAELLKTAMLTAVPQAIKDVIPVYVDLEVGGFGA